MLWEEVLEFVGSKVCLGGNARYAIAHRSAQANKCLAKCSEFFMDFKIDALEHCKNYNVAGFSLECECLDDNQGTERQNCELECENGGKRDWREEATMDGNGPVVETLAQVTDGSRNAI